MISLSRRAFLLIVSVLICLPSTSTAADSQPLSLVPLPKEVERKKGQFTLTPKTRILANKGAEATARYLADFINTPTGFELTVTGSNTTESFSGSIALILTPEAKELGEEGYILSVAKESVRITAPTTAGLFYGVQTLRQLLPPEIENKKPSDEVTQWTIPCVAIKDKPLYRQRGLMLDPARQFLTVDYLKRYIDLMAFHKMNWLHLHLTDNQAWTVQIKRYPQLTDMKLWPPDARDPKWDAGVYSQDDIRELVSYAASRHITIIPEIEIPAHFSVIGGALPEVMCPNNPRRKDKEQWAPLQSHQWVGPCPGSDSACEILENILTEVMDLFPSSYIHLGSDEWHCKAWANCPKCQKHAKEIRQAKTHAPGNDSQLLYRDLMNRMCRHVVARNRKPIFWYDSVWTGAPFPKGSVVHMWHEHGRRPHLRAAQAGHEVFCSSVPVLYFDLGNPSAVAPVYSFDAMPASMAGTPLAKKLIGMSAPLWNQKQSQVDHRAFPRSSALAEIAWTPREKLDWADFSKRRERYQKRLEKMGVQGANMPVAPHVPVMRGDVVGRWDPKVMLADEKPVTLKWDITSHLKRTGKYTVVLDYEKGLDGVYIEWVVIEADGKEISRDAHRGWTGAADENNVYKVNIPEIKPGVKYILKTKMFIPNGGIDSAGKVELCCPH